MNLSEEKLKLFERLYEEEGETVRRHKSFCPPQFDDKKFLLEYRFWRLEAKEKPLFEQARRETRELIKRERDAQVSAKKNTS